MKMDQLQKRVWKGRFFVRVPLENSKGMIYFTKENSLQAVFIRQNYNNKAIPTELSNSELIDLNSRSIRTITYKNNKADSLYTFVANQSPQSSNRYTIMSGTFWQDLACLLTFGSPYWAMDNSRQCARGINWGSIGTFLASVFFTNYTDSAGDGIPFDFAYIIGFYPQYTFPNNPGDQNQTNYESTYYGGGGGSFDSNGNWIPYVPLLDREPAIPAPPFVWRFVEDDGTVFNDLEPNLEPDIQFDSADNYEVLFPNFTALVKNLKTFLKNNKEVMSALQKWSGFSKQQIIDKLTYQTSTNGPVIKLVNMPATNYGHFNGVVNNRVLEISLPWVMALEKAAFNVVVNNDNVGNIVIKFKL